MNSLNSLKLLKFLLHLGNSYDHILESTLFTHSNGWLCYFENKIEVRNTELKLNLDIDPVDIIDVTTCIKVSIWLLKPVYLNKHLQQLKLKFLSNSQRKRRNDIKEGTFGGGMVKSPYYFSSHSVKYTKWDTVHSQHIRKCFKVVKQLQVHTHRTGEKKHHFRAAVNMDIAYMKIRAENNSSGDKITNDFITENPEISIPYLTLISLFILNGSIGNFMVIASVLSYKVNI